MQLFKCPYTSSFHNFRVKQKQQKQVTAGTFSAILSFAPTFAWPRYPLFADQQQLPSPDLGFVGLRAQGRSGGHGGIHSPSEDPLDRWDHLGSLHWVNIPLVTIIVKTITAFFFCENNPCYSRESQHLGSRWISYKCKATHSSCFFHRTCEVNTYFTYLPKITKG